ncbi:hypothetical protein EUGRSUZ_C01486 [Eucalyptus grandis]|uniref:Uncharacterized protein n=2 Tax=Eucalyptus grandis TaxID=71139 RepID=A0ACC3LDA5_EUCGR|nr:hypothetical protein EUGRSUZ_C01486 [Eucalyptus grandis]
MATELKVLNLNECKFLKRTPDLSTFKRLEILHLVLCYNLEELHPSIEKLASLIELDLTDCVSITKLPESIWNLRNMRVLDISGTHITELPDAIGMLAKLQKLRAWVCKLEGVSSNICKLTSLEELYVGYCEKLQELPELPSGLTYLSSGLTYLPSSLTYLVIAWQGQSLPHLSQLTHLKYLCLSHCHRLECVPELPIGLSELAIARCGKLKALTNLSDLKHLREFSIFESPSLEGSPDVSNFRRTQMIELGLKESRGFMGSLIFERSPRWFPWPED